MANQSVAECRRCSLVGMQTRSSAGHQSRLWLRPTRGVGLLTAACFHVS
jgi:hypothetical protein